MAASIISKSKASTLTKIAALPRYRHPMDLLNQKLIPFEIQNKVIAASLKDPTSYYSQSHFNLAANLCKYRQSYIQTSQSNNKQLQKIAHQQFNSWDQYLQQSGNKHPLSQIQKQRVYQSMLTAKERNQQRLALQRFVKFGYQYSQGFKMDIGFDPVVLMKLIHPHFGYFNKFPNVQHLKYTHQSLYRLIQQIVAISHIRQSGHSLHSSELLSFLFWKTLVGNKSRLNTQQFSEMIKIFKYEVKGQEILNYFRYSISEGMIKKDNMIRFQVFRKIFLDRNL